MAFGAKIKLSVDTSGASSFRSQIQKHVNTATAENPIKLKNFSVAITKEKQKQLINDLQTYLTDDKKTSININYPLFINNGISIINYNENINLFDIKLERTLGYKNQIFSFL